VAKCMKCNVYAHVGKCSNPKFIHSLFPEMASSMEILHSRTGKEIWGDLGDCKSTKSRKRLKLGHKIMKEVREQVCLEMGVTVKENASHDSISVEEAQE